MQLNLNYSLAKRFWIKFESLCNEVSKKMNLAEETTCDGSAGQPDASDTAVQDKSTPPSVTSSHQCKKHRRRLHTSNDVTHRNKRDDVGPEVKTSPRMTSSTHRYASFRVADILSRDSTSASQYKPGNSLTSHS